MSRIDKLLIEARARATWGESPELIREWLTDQGVEPDEADQIVRQCVTERASSMRERGMRDLVIGGPLLALSVLIAVAAYYMLIGLSLRLAALVITFCVLVGIYGTYRLIKAADRLIFGARAEGADTDVDGFL